MRYAVVANGIVENVIEAGPNFAIPGKALIELQEDQSAGPGDLWDGTEFTRPESPSEPATRYVPPFVFRRVLFTQDERHLIMEAELSDVLIADFMDDLRTIRDDVDLQHPDTIAGIDYLVSKLLVTPERKAQILSGIPPQ